MKRVLRILPMAALLCLLLSGCRTAPLPEGMEEETMLTTSRELVAALIQEDYQTVADAFRSDVGERYGVDADAIKTLMDSVEGAGAYQKEIDAMTSGGKDDAFDEPYGVASIYCKHEKDKVMYTFSLDPKLNLIGFSVKQQ